MKADVVKGSFRYQMMRWGLYMRFINLGSAAVLFKAKQGLFRVQVCLLQATPSRTLRWKMLRILLAS